MKKKKKINKIFLAFIIIMALYLITLGFFTKSILTLEGIETLYRIIALVIFFLLAIMYFIVGFTCSVGRRRKTFIVFSVIITIFIPVFIIGSYYIDKTYNKISSFNKETITYTSNLIALKDTTLNNNKSEKLGMINDATDIEGYILAKKLIKKEQINLPEIVYYDDYPDMLKALYDKEINGTFVSSNYEILFGNEDEFKTINEDITVLYTYSEEREKETEKSNKKLTEPFTILLIGVDGTGTKLNANQSFNGDTLMLITFNPNTLNVTMLSIPRDTYVPIACRNNKEAKINTSAYGGTNCVINTIENLTDINIDYYVKMNFSGLVNLVNALDGIDVEVPYAFCEQDSQRRFGNYTVYVEEGLQHLNGEQALALSRNRHCWSNYCASKYNTNCGIRNDFKRGQNQQLVVTALGNEIKNIRSFTEFYKLLDAVSSSMDTNISANQMLSLYEVAKNILTNSLGTNAINIEKTYLMTYNQMIDNRSMEIYYPESLKEIVNAMKENLELQKPKAITTFTYSINELYEKKIIGKTSSGGVSLKDTVPSFIGKSKAYINEWASSKGISINYENVNIGDSLYKDSYEEGYVVSQNIKATTLLDNVKTITIYVIKKDNTTNDPTPEKDPVIDDLLE